MTTGSIPTLIDHLAYILEDIAEKRYDAKKKLIQAQNLNPSEYDDAIDAIEKAFTRELRLVDLRYDELYYQDFYEEFCEICEYFKHDIKQDDLDLIYDEMIKAIYKAKLSILDSYSNPDKREQIARFEELKYEGISRFIWTPAQERFSEQLAEDLRLAFKPLLDVLEKKKINLYIKHGSIPASEGGLGMTSEYPPAYVFDALGAYFDDIFTRHSSDKSHRDYNLDYALSVLLWNALSMEYVKNANDQDVDVYLPDGTITTSSIFWNYELHSLHKMQSDADMPLRTVHYHRLKKSVKKDVDKTIDKLTKYTKELNDIRDKLYQDQEPPLEVQEKSALTLRKHTLKDSINRLENTKYALCAEKNNWEEIQFKDVKLKGLKVQDKPMTVETMIKVGQLLKKRINEKMQKKAEQPKRTHLTPMKETQKQQLEQKQTRDDASIADLEKAEPTPENSKKGIEF